MVRMLVAFVLGSIFRHLKKFFAIGSTVKSSSGSHQNGCTLACQARLRELAFAMCLVCARGKLPVVEAWA